MRAADIEKGTDVFDNKQAFGPFYTLSIRQTHSHRLYATSYLSAVVFVHRPSKAIMPSFIAKRFQGSHASWLSWSKPVRHEEKAGSQTSTSTNLRLE